MSTPVLSAAGAASGLTSDEARLLLARYGPNEIAEKSESLFHRVARHFWSPVAWMLEVAIVLELATGGYAVAGLVAAVLIFNAALGTIEEGRADAALALLKQRLALRARVRRDNRWTEIAARDLVPGDIIQLSLGSIVPADARILSGSLLLDQSMLTGESMPVEATAEMPAYSGALVRRGEALASVTATGAGTYFGRTAELVQIANVTSDEDKAVFGVVRNLSIVNALTLIWLIVDALHVALPTSQIIALVLTSLLAAIPVALAAAFTLAEVLGSHGLALKGVLLTRLSALEEAATIDVVCADKTGTLTNNELGVATVVPLLAGWSEGDVLGYGALASSADGRDPVDAAVREAAHRTPPTRVLPVLQQFTPFDPAAKRAEAQVLSSDGASTIIRKGAPESLGAIPPTAAAPLAKLTAAGYRTLGVTTGAEGENLVGFIALSDTPRTDSAQLLRDLTDLGVRTVMVTGDTVATATTVAHAIGLDGAVCPAGHITDDAAATECTVYAEVFPEDKFRLVQALQRAGHAVGMCGDGANDAPALRQAQMGIAVSTATDIAKAAAAMVLTKPGLEGILTAIRGGRTVFRRIVTYTFMLMINKCITLFVLAAGLWLTGHALLTPLLQALSMLIGDFGSLARTTDNVTPSAYPNRWRLRNMTLAALPMAGFKLVYCVGVLSVGLFFIKLNLGQMQTLTWVLLAFASQAVMYVTRERGRLWNSAPSKLVILSSLLNVTVILAFASLGIFMQALPITLIATVLGATALFTLLLDQVKIALFRVAPID